MAQYEVGLVGKQKHKKEHRMQQNETPPETNAQTDNKLDEAVEAALAGVGDPQVQAEAEVSAREAAALEERLSAERIAQNRNESDKVEAEVQPEESMGATASKGREHLLARLREHSAQQTKVKEEYSPPPMTDRQRSVLEEEQEAGRRAQAKHQQQWDNRPVRPRDPREGGPATPVHRPNDVVPDPTLTNTSGFAAGTKRYSADV